MVDFFAINGQLNRQKIDSCVQKIVDAFDIQNPCDWGGIGSGRIEIISIGSDRVFVGSDRFFMKNVGFRWNPMRIRSKTTGSAGRIDSPGRLHYQNKTSLWTTNSWRISDNLRCTHDPFTVTIRYKTTDCIVSVKYMETAKYGTHFCAR
jgi:hypothetical protein